MQGRLAVRTPGSLWLTVGLLLAVAMSACQSPSGDERAQRDPTRLVASDEVAVPPRLEQRQLKPLTGEAMKRAQLSLEDVLAELREPDYLTRAREAHAERADDEQPSEPPVAVQRAYMKARQAWRENNYHEAIRELEAALRRSPGQPHLLRLQARAYGSIGNRLRSAMHLRQALEADPDDLDSLFVLGRMTIEQGEPEDAVVLFARALAVADAGDGWPGGGPSLAVLHYLLAAALLDAGYPAAAIEQHRQYLKLTDEGDLTREQTSELDMQDRQQGSTWLAVGDAHHRLDDPAAALKAYEQAARRGLADEAVLIHRLIYTYLRLGEAEPATQLTIERVRAAGGDEPSLDLVAYLTEQGISASALTDELTQLYEAEGESPAMALAVAELMPREQAMSLLTRHLTRHPADERVFERLLNDWLLPEGAAEAEPEAIHAAVKMTAKAMNYAQTFSHAEVLASRLFNAAGDTGVLLDAWADMPADQRDEPTVLVLEGMALGIAGRAREAEAAFEQAMTGDDELMLARLQLAKLMISREQFDRASRLLEPLEDSTDNVPVLLRVRVLAETDRADEALTLLEQVMRDQRRPPTDLVLQKAQLQVMADDGRAAERTLLDALNVRPEEERIYVALFDLYSPGSPSAEQIGDWQRQWTRLVRRLLGTIPESRIGRLVRSQLLDAQGQRGEAESLLKQLLDEDPRDHEALQQLLEVYVRSDRRDEARALVEARLEAHPDDVGLLSVAHRFYQQIGDRDRVLEVVEQLLALEPADEARARNLASLYMQTDRPERALAVIEEALAAEHRLDDPMPLVRVLWRAALQAEDAEAADRRLTELAEQLPEHHTDLTYERAMLADQLDDKQASEAMLLEVLEHDPDHARANNALGYTWTVQNRDLERAKAMIQRAVDAEPDNAAYLDSLGWVYYKMGRFEEAVVWLRRSRAADFGDYPVIVDHLGDALYRLGRPDDAVRYWREAQSLLEQEDYSVYEDPELEELPDRLSAKIDAVEADREPAVAKLPEEEQANDENAGESDDNGDSDNE
ncbi:tetratricopeptide repeat protein [Phycisphaerales bacterium AB-hyl4]|uniref:Tetratricopeptide repeat protein n=1 Tax=Natronomicrosphaera hydrolytica TaxID=3242702 RepID=A0ABV4U2X1_9BACT